MDTLSVYSFKEAMVRDAFVEGLSPSKLILDRTGDRLFNRKFGIYSEAGVSLFNFMRNDDFDLEETNEALSKIV